MRTALTLTVWLVVAEGCALDTRALYACDDGRCPAGLRCVENVCRPERQASGGGVAGGSGRLAGGGDGGGVAVVGGGAAGGGDASCVPATACTADLTCGFVDAGCGVTAFCGRCPAPLECGTEVANRCGEPRVCTPEGWCWEHPLPHGGGAVAAFSIDERHMWFGTESGSLVFWDGERTRGTRFPTQAGVPIRVIHGTAPNDLYVGAEGARLFRFDGTTWTKEPIPTSGAVVALWAADAGVVAGVSNGTVWRRTSQGWVEVTLNPSPNGAAIRGVFRVGALWHAVAATGQVFRGSDSTWTAVATPGGLDYPVVSAVLARDGGSLVAVGGTSAPDASIRVSKLDLVDGAKWVDVASFAGAGPAVWAHPVGPRVWVTAPVGASSIVTNVFFIDFHGDGGASVGRVSSPSGRQVRALVGGPEELVAGGSGGYLAFIRPLDGGFSYTDNLFAENRTLQEMNNGCAKAATPGAPLAVIMADRNTAAERQTSGRWRFSIVGNADAGYDWLRCDFADSNTVWAVGRDTRPPGLQSSWVARNRGGAWELMSPGPFFVSESWVTVSSFPDGRVLFLTTPRPPRNSLIVSNFDGGVSSGSFGVFSTNVALNDLVAVNSMGSAQEGAVQAVGDLFFYANSGSPSLVNGSITGSSVEWLAIHGRWVNGAAYTVAGGKAGALSVRNASQGSTTFAGSSDFTNVWVSSRRTAYLLTSIDAGAAFRQSANVVIRLVDGGVRSEPVPFVVRATGLFGVDELDGTTRVWVTGAGGAVLRKDFSADGG